MPIDKTVHVRLAGEVAFDASSAHEIRFAIEGDPPPGTRIARLTLVVSNLGGAVVYRAVWGAEAEHAVAIEGAIPPAEHVWAAIDNQGDENRPIAALSAPYLVAIHTVLEVAEQDEIPPPELHHDDPLQQCNARDERVDDEVVEEAPRPCALTSLQLAASGATSAARLPETLRVEEAGRPARLPFVAGVEEDVEIRWTLENAARATGGQLALFASDALDPVWQADLSAELVQGGRLRADDNPADTFVAEHIRLDRAPLRLQLTIQGDPLDVARAVAWTWVDVQVTGMRLRWGHGRALATARDDVHESMRPEALRQELLLLRALKQQAPPDPVWRAADELRGDDDDVGATDVDPGGDDRLYLVSNQYYRGIQDWENDTAFVAHRHAWGHGPRLPIMVDLMLRRAAGGEVAAPSAALGGARVMWDWLDPQLDKHGGQPDVDFLQWALTRANDDRHRSDDDSPASTNCHVADGGKRGTGAAPIFPAGVGTNDDDVAVGTHPFPVAALVARPWAATSGFYRGADERYRNRSGVLFQPSRIAGDAYRVRAYVWRRPDAAVGHVASGDALWAAAEALGQATLPHAQTGRFTVWRQLSVVRYVKKNGVMAAIDFVNVNAKLAHACVRIDAPLPSAPAVARIWADGGFEAMLAGDDGHSLMGNNRLRGALLPPGARVATTSAFPLMSWTRMAATAVRQALAVNTGNAARDLRFQAAHGNINLPGHPETWATALDSLGLDDHATLQASVPAGFPANPETVSCDVTSTRACFRALATYLLGRSSKDTYSRVLSAMARYHDQARAGDGDDDPELGALPGLYLFHFEGVVPGFYDVSGAAAAARGIDADVPWTRRRGIFYVCYTNWAEKIEVDMATNVTPTAPQIADISIPSYLSQSFIDGAETQLDHAAFVALRMHSAALAVLDTMDARELGPGPRRAANTSVLRNDDYGLTITVKSRDQGRANAVRNALRQVLNPNVQTHAHVQDERKVYVSLVNPFSRVAACKVKFWVGRNTLADSNKRTLFDFVSHVLSHVGHRVVDIHVYYRDTAAGRARRDAVRNYIDAVFTALRDHVRVRSQHGADVFDRVYDLESLVTHELGHTLFLGHQHDNQYAWRHIRRDDFNCIMNYDPAAHAADNHFCGMCNVGLRGWNTGTNGARRFDAYYED